MRPERLEILATTDGFSVIVDGNRFSESLSPDEALGVAATFIFRPDNVLYIRTAEETVRRNAAFKRPRENIETEIADQFGALIDGFPKKAGE